MMKKMASLLLSMVISISMLAAVPVTANEVGAQEGILVGAISFYGTKDASGEILPDLSGASQVSAKVHIENRGDALEEVGIYVAYYAPNHMLLDVDFDVTEFAAGQEETVWAGLEIAKATPGRYARAFVWSETNHALTPLVKEQTLMATENVYVAPGGNDQAAGTFAEPLQTVTAARDLVRTRNADMTEDIFVYLRGGTYQLDDTLSFEAADSGTNGNDVIYMPYKNENVTISGGQAIDGWDVYDAEKNIWVAELSGIDHVRELYVNGKKATRAQGEGKIYPQGFYKETVDDTEKTLGYVVSSDDVGLYNRDEDIQLRFVQLWKSSILNVDEIREGEDGTRVLILNPDAFSKIISSSRYIPLRHDTSFYIENAYELLNSEGEFYYDKTEKRLYYMPESNEDMSTAEVVVPVLEKLMEIKGDNLNNKVKNIAFDGITFAHSTRTDMDNGYLGDQAQEKTPIYPIDSSYPVDNTFVGGNIRVAKAENISFTNNTFMGLSAVGLGLYDGANNVVIRGNCFYDLGDSAITVGLPTDAFMEENYDAGSNVALFKPATSNGAVSTEATNANDGDRTTLWSNPNSSKDDYVQIDLGKAYTISEVRLKSRLGTTASATEIYRTQDVHRRGFRIYASNDADFTDGGVDLATVSNASGNEFDYDTGFVGAVTATEKYRYIRFSTTVKKHFPLAEIEVISPDETAPNKEVCKNAEISNNYITRVGDANWGAPGIQLYHTEGINILHNIVKDVPYSGICVGWGWTNKSGSQTTKNNTINYNVIDGFATRMYDAGGVYMNGPQQNTQVNYNYIKNQKNIYYSLYSDSGSQNFTATNNVFEDIDYVFVLGREGNPSDKTGITIKDNYSTSNKYGFVFIDGVENDVEEPHFYLRTKPTDAVRAIKEQAGLQAEYAGLLSKVPATNKIPTLEDTYSNVIDRHVDSYESEITSLTDYNIVVYYLSAKLTIANAILEAGKDYVDEDTYNKFKNTISTIARTRTNYYAITSPTDEEREAGGSVHTTENLNRRAVIETRIELENAIEEYLNATAQ